MFPISLVYFWRENVESFPCATTDRAESGISGSATSKKKAFYVRYHSLYPLSVEVHSSCVLAGHIVLL